MELHEIYAPLDAGIAELVLLLREHGHNTFTSCEGGKGHNFQAPTIRIKPENPHNMQRECHSIAYLLSSKEYSGYYLKQCQSYQAEARPWQPEKQAFIEIEFWEWYEDEE